MLQNSNTLFSQEWTLRLKTFEHSVLRRISTSWRKSIMWDEQCLKNLAGQIGQTATDSWAHLSDQQRGKKLNSSCPCFPFIIFQTETHQLWKLLNSHLFTQMFLKPTNLLVDPLTSQSLGSQLNKQTRLNTGHWIQSMYLTGLTETTDDVGPHRKHNTFARLSDKE